MAEILLFCLLVFHQATSVKKYISEEEMSLFSKLADILPTTVYSNETTLKRNSVRYNHDGDMRCLLMNHVRNIQFVSFRNFDSPSAI